MIDSYPLEWEESLKKVLAMDWDRLITGHPGPGGRLGLKLPKYESWAGDENNLPLVLRRYCGLWGRGT